MKRGFFVALFLAAMFSWGAYADEDLMLDVQVDQESQEQNSETEPQAFRFQTYAACMNWCMAIPSSEFNSKWGSKSAQCGSWCKANSGTAQ